MGTATAPESGHAGDGNGRKAAMPATDDAHLACRHRPPDPPACAGACRSDETGRAARLPARGAPASLAASVARRSRTQTSRCTLAAPRRVAGRLERLERVSDARTKAWPPVSRRLYSVRRRLALRAAWDHPYLSWSWRRLALRAACIARRVWRCCLCAACTALLDASGPYCSTRLAHAKHRQQRQPRRSCGAGTGKRAAAQGQGTRQGAQRPRAHWLRRRRNRGN